MFVLDDSCAEQPSVRGRERIAARKHENWVSTAEKRTGGNFRSYSYENGKSVREAKEVLVRDILLADFDGVDDRGGRGDFSRAKFKGDAVARAKFGDGRESIAIVAPIGCLEEEVKGGGGKGGDDRIKEEEADAVAALALRCSLR